MSNIDHLIGSVAADTPFLKHLRRDLHAHPELCFEEHRTSELIARTLTEWGISVHRGLAKTGVVGVIKHSAGARSIGLRADIDALPITECSIVAHASVHPGKMHACGHDGHTVMLLAAAKHLSQRRDLEGTIYLIFQPAEEAGGGAREMIKEGLFERFPMQAIFGIHNWPGLPVGQFAVRSGPVFASTNDFKITIHGRGTHAAMPHGGIDPVPVACQIVQAFQTIITRNMRPLDAGVISVTRIHAGEATNVIPNTCELQGTVRAFQTDVLDMVERRMREVAEGICQAFSARCQFEFRRLYPPTVNHQNETEFVRRVLGGFVGERNVQTCEPTMGAEDFSYYLREKPGCYFLIGHGEGEHRISDHSAGTCTLHSPSYDFNDELIPIGGSMWVRLVEAWMRQSA